MHIATQLLIGLVALLHLYFLWMEMFAWTTVGRKTFRSLPSELFEPTKALAANQGLEPLYKRTKLARTHCQLLPNLYHHGRNLWSAHRFSQNFLRTSITCLACIVVSLSAVSLYHNSSS
jgi:uncharacterized membrane protein